MLPKPLSKRTVRTIRTVLQIVLAVASVVPALVEKLPDPAVAAQLVVVAGLVTHYFGVIEQLPFFPDALRVDEPAAEPNNLP